jgi:thioesterase domain-containing protein
MLREAGEEVELLALIDGYPSAGRPPGSNAAKQTQDVAMVRRLHIDGTALSGADDERAAELAAILEHNTGLAEEHKPPMFNGDMLFFSATGHRDTAELEPTAWQPFITGSVRTHAVAARHHEMMQPEPLARITEVLGEELGWRDRARRRSPFSGKSAISVRGDRCPPRSRAASGHRQDSDL